MDPICQDWQEICISHCWGVVVAWLTFSSPAGLMQSWDYGEGPQFFSLLCCHCDFNAHMSHSKMSSSSTHGIHALSAQPASCTFQQVSQYHRTGAQDPGSQALCPPCLLSCVIVNSWPSTPLPPSDLWGSSLSPLVRLLFPPLTLETSHRGLSSSKFQ